MKGITLFFTKLYQYATIFIAVGAPLFFIPRIGFSGDVTYHIAMMLLVAVALFSYVLVALITRTWHTVSRFEFAAYTVFSVAALLSVLFSKTPGLILFGEAFNQFSGVALLSLPVVMYLVRTLPENVRRKLKFAIVGVLGVASFVFVSALIFGGHALSATKFLFSGFSSSMSLSVYLGLFSVIALFYVKKGGIKKRYKSVVLTMALLFIAWTVTISSQNSIRPNLSSTLLAGKQVLLNEGVFGIGAGNFARAWQLYKPQDVVNSQYFSYDFSVGSDTMTTFFVTVGIVGLVGFMMLVLSALYNTIRNYRATKEGEEHMVLGILSFTLIYFLGVSFLVPLTYSMLVMWMVVAGLGIAKTPLTEFHPSKKVGYIVIPVMAILVVNAFMTVNKARAFNYFNSAQTAKTVEEAEASVLKATQLYKFDGFYRVLVEYGITANRNLLSTPTEDQEALKNAYLKKAQVTVDYALLARDLNPHNYQNYVSLGRAYELAVPFDKDNAFKNAENAYNEAIKLYPENPYLYLMAARLETSAGTREGVREHLTGALKTKQNFADALYLMSQLEASESKIEEALAYAIEAIKSAPNDPATYVQAGLLFYGKRDYENAVLALRTALEKDQNNPNIAYFLALSLRDGGRPDLALPIAEELLRRNQGNTEIEQFLKSLTPAKEEKAPAAKTR